MTFEDILQKLADNAYGIKPICITITKDIINYEYPVISSKNGTENADFFADLRAALEEQLDFPISDATWSRILKFIGISSNDSYETLTVQMSEFVELYDWLEYHRSEKYPESEGG